MDPLIYIRVSRRDLTHILAADKETSTEVIESLPERLQRLMDKEPEQEEHVELTTADLLWIKCHISQVKLLLVYIYCSLIIFGYSAS